MQTVGQIHPLRDSLAELREKSGAGAKVALVPTMGALHDGHLSLVRRAGELADVVVASIFVNPRQFGAGEDLDAYPRQLAADKARLDGEGVDLLWAPDGAAMYPDGYATNVSVAGVSEGLCGGNRPGHFDGVATVVLKLFNQVRPDIAIFGEKDWQQLAVIRRMARDLDLSAPHYENIVGGAIVREADGLAMSSRNAYLSDDQRSAAAALPRAMRAAIARMNDRVCASEALETLKSDLVQAGFDSIDYAEVRDSETIALQDEVSDNSRLFVAARIGNTRLIDNMAVRQSVDAPAGSG